MDTSSGVLLALLREGNWGAYQQEMEHFLATPYAAALRQALSALQRDALYMSHVHGVGHIERTMLHGAMCAAAEHLDAADTQLLMLMCSYHDTGRVNDWLDNAHGYRSSLRLQTLTGLSGDELRLAMAGVEAHSLSDKAMQQVLDRHAAADAARARRLAELLKDADGLDRVRINDLNPRFLRRDASRERAGFAQYLFDRYTSLERQGEPNSKADGYDLPTIAAVKSFVAGCLSDGFSCTQTALLALGNLTGLLIPQPLLDEAADHGEICGLMEAGTRFLREAFARRGLSEERIAEICRTFRQAFTAQYASDRCQALKADPQAQSCPGFSVDGILFANTFFVETKNKIDGAGLI